MTTATPDDADADANGPLIRQAERADLLAVFHIEQEAFPQPWPFSAFEQFLDEPGFLVAQARRESDTRESTRIGDDGRVVGYVVADRVTEHDRALGHIKDIAVAEERRGEGIGRLLLQRALTGFGVEDVEAVKLEVRESNEAARNLYRKFSFEHRETLPRYYSNGENALVMVREF